VVAARSAGRRRGDSVATVLAVRITLSASGCASSQAPVALDTPPRVADKPDAVQPGWALALPYPDHRADWAECFR
jgi:hypothetical protein